MFLFTSSVFRFVYEIMNYKRRKIIKRFKREYTMLMGNDVFDERKMRET